MREWWIDPVPIGRTPTAGQIFGCAEHSNDRRIVRVVELPEGAIVLTREMLRDALDKLVYSYEDFDGSIKWDLNETKLERALFGDRESE